MSSKKSALTPEYTRWMLEATAEVFGSEPASTCGDCVMCQPPKAGLGRVFSPNVKCCTYWPDLPNFLVGRTLKAGGEGARRLRAQIEGRRGVTPFGLQASPQYHRRYEAQPEKFGADETMMCPYYEQGDCTIWLNRNSICQTYFCRTEAGVPGQAVWRQLTLLLALVEEKLSVDCAKRRLHHPAFYTAGFQANGSRNRVTTRSFSGWIEEDGRISDELHQQLWGDWEGREAAFFEACAEDVENLEWPEVVRRVGAEAEVLAHRLKALAALHPPAFLRPAMPGLAFEYQEVEGGVAYAPAAGSWDVHLAPTALWNALQDFAGGPLTEAGLAVPDHPLSHAAAVELWKSGLLTEGKAAVTTDLLPSDRLRGALAMQERIRFSETGVATVELTVGVTQLSFEEPELLAFARTLYARRLGFLAEEVMEWSGRTWEATAELLGNLLEIGVLERVSAR